MLVVTSAAFGLAHLYQGLRGVVLTGVVGAVLGSLLISSGSIVPPIVVHALVDLRILALPDLSDPQRSLSADAQ